MKKLTFSAAVLIILFSLTPAQCRTFGIGIIAGEPTGISAKWWLDKTMALDFAAAWSFVGEGSIHIHSDYLWHNFDIFKIKAGELAVYYGAGIYLQMRRESALGARIPVGLEYLFENSPVDIFLEIVPILELVPATVLGLNGGIGIRFNF